MKKILILTDFDNNQEEDEWLKTYLDSDFDARLVDFKTVHNYEDDCNLIVVRNTWPDDEKDTLEYHNLSQKFFSRAREKNLKLYNSWDAHGDRDGKDYLVELYKKGFPVIPSFDCLENVSGEGSFLVKPKDGFSSFGIKEISFNDLGKVNFGKNIVQPKLKFKGELSFYCVDDEIVYALYFDGSEEKNWMNPVVYEIKTEDVKLVRKFLKWNGLSHGLQRVDFLLLEDGSLLLLEIEDDSPYLSFEEIDKKYSEKFMSKLKESICEVLENEM